MCARLGVFPHEATNSEVLAVGDLLMVSTSNGQNEGHMRVPSPRAPSLIAVDKHSGEVVWRAIGAGEQVLHGQWSSPAAANVNANFTARAQDVGTFANVYVFALAPAKIAKAMAALQSHTTTGANHPAQYAAAAALGDERVEQDVNRMVGEFRKRRDMVVARFRQDLPGVEFVDPLGAFYFFFRVDSFGKITGTDFCTRLITQSGVALVPGAAFGDDRWVRLSYAAATDSIKQALDRIVSFARKLGD